MYLCSMENLPPLNDWASSARLLDRIVINLEKSQT